MQGSQDLTFPSPWHRSRMQTSDDFLAPRATGTARLVVKLLSLGQSSHVKLPTGHGP